MVLLNDGLIRVEIAVVVAASKSGSGRSGHSQAMPVIFDFDDWSCGRAREDHLTFYVNRRLYLGILYCSPLLFTLLVYLSKERRFNRLKLTI